jgi:hypothetical protein
MNAYIGQYSTFVKVLIHLKCELLEDQITYTIYTRFCAGIHGCIYLNYYTLIDRNCSYLDLIDKNL